MNNQEIRDVLINELGIESLPEEAQNEVVAKVGDIILKSLTLAILDKLSIEARAEFEHISEKGDEVLIQEFLNDNVPNLSTLMEEEIRKTLRNLALNETSAEKPKERGEI